jgi:hypothetical protein
LEIKQVRAALILVFLLTFSLPGPGFGVPIKSVPEPDINSGDLITAVAAPGPSSAQIPDSPVQMFIRQGPNSRFELFFIDVGNGHDLVDFEFYKAWCLAKGKPIRRNAIHKIRLYKCYDPDIPPEYRGMGWNQINYVINHKSGSKEAVQQAIWYFTNSEKPISLGEEASQLVEEANLKGKEYKPGHGELIAIICRPDEKKQPVFIEYKIPEGTASYMAPASAPLSAFVAALVPASGPASLGPVTSLPEAASSSSWFSAMPFFPIIPQPPDSPPLHSPPYSPPHSPPYSPPYSPPPDPGPPGPPTPDTPSVPEPSSVLLLVSGMAGIQIYRTISKRIKRA